MENATSGSDSSKASSDQPGGAWHDDPVTGYRVRVAPTRADRPNDYSGDDFDHAGNDEPAQRCPFCAGSEPDTPAETDRIDDARGAWLTRVVPNIFPAIDGDAGAQEVVIESPRHAQRFIHLTPEEATAAVTAWARRIIHWQQDGRFDYTLVFKNEGPAAGASLEHAHSQVLALPKTPGRVTSLWERLKAASAPPREHATWSDDNWCIVTPDTQRFAYESWIRPNEEAPGIAELAAGQGTERLAACLQRVIAATIELSGQPAYNLILQVPPVSFSNAFAGHLAGQWWLEIVPRGSGIAGLELATGLWVNAVPPKRAARQLREKLG